MNNIFATPKQKLIKLTNEVPKVDNSYDLGPTTIRRKKDYSEIGLLEKIGIFFRLTSYTITLLLFALVIYTVGYGWPPIMRYVELSFIEDRVEEMAKSLSKVEDTVVMNQIHMEKALEKRNK